MKGQLEKDYSAKGLSLIGVDEVGRGCLAGPVYAAIVSLDYQRLDALPPKTRDLIRDSKKLSPKQRATIVPVIHEIAVEAFVASATEAEIDRLGIVPATFLAMRRCYEQLTQPYHLLLIDGNQINPQITLRQECVIGGDSLCFAIAAASILAKEARDSMMQAAHEQYPEYGFASHVGYGTQSHLQAIESHGITPLHRRSFAPIRRVVESQLEYQQGALG